MYLSQMFVIKDFDIKKAVGLSSIIITIIALTFTGCEEEVEPAPSSNYYVTYTWDGNADYRITFWLQSDEQQYLSLNTGNASNQGSFTSPEFQHANNLDLAIKTALEFSSDDCANVQMTLFRDSVPVLTKDYIMGEPTNINCTGDNFRQELFTP